MVIFIASIVGAALGFQLANAMNNGWFKSSWQMIESPPVNVQSLVGINKDSLWVQSDLGAFYYNENSSTCKTNCWREVLEIPDLPIVGTHETTVTPEACAPTPPLIKVTARIAECRREQWVDRSFVFVLHKDDSIYLWQADLYQEWSIALLFLGICFGATALFLLALIYVLFFGLVERMSKRANKKTKEKISDTA